jgi:UDP:flavonoid glycosyltransferase YjiC (YdhE family)
VHLGKPVLSVPVDGQFEQVLNARYVAHLGYGAYAPRATAEAVAAFVDGLPGYEQALAGYARAGNDVAVDEVRARLAQAVGAAAT